MNIHIRCAALLLVAASAPVSVSAAVFDLSDVELTAFATFSTQLTPEKNDFDAKSAPFGSSNLTKAAALVRADGVLGIPFPNAPTSQTLPFASSAGDNFGVFGVGVNGFFCPNSIPPNALVAGGRSRKPSPTIPMLPCPWSWISSLPPRPSNSSA